MWKPLGALLLAAGAAAPAIAQPTAPERDASPKTDIVIQGVRPSDKQVTDFVRALTAVPSSGQISRFHSPVCPVAMGLPQVQNDRIAERMRLVAAAATMPVAPVKCSPNAFVIVAPDKAAAIRDLERRFPAYLSQLSEREVRKLTDAASPAAAWQVKSLLTADGEAAAKAVGADYYTVSGTQSPSRIKAASMPTFSVSVVVIDVKAAAGLTLTQLADYAAMRTFADVAPERIARVGVPSILDVLAQPDDRPLPVTLTYWDLGFLKSLYATDNSYYASYQRGDMQRVVKKEVEHSGRDPRN
ncbi:MAG: hypothetical protein ACJ8E3_03015 [Sphingomicrobium sp.]